MTTAGREDERVREAAARQARIAARRVAAERTGWEPWMTWLVGYAGNGPEWLAETEATDYRRTRYAREDAAAGRGRAAR